ncbi:MAG TPA: sialidase family protein [Candidatus Dormibacteraeota bacterium]|nr:sialidase family protein [Candidatus Dormibacteraeota bacterium]
MRSTRLLLSATALIVAMVISRAAHAQSETWTPTGSSSNQWYAVACSADGTRVAAATGGQFDVTGQIHISTDSGTNWTVTSAPLQRWTCVASSADGTKLIGAAYDRGIYTSADSGTTWTSNNVANVQFGLWNSVGSSADGSTLFATRYRNFVLYSSSNSGVLWAPTTNNLADLFSVAVSADGTIAVASDNNGHVASSTNSGLTWSTNTFLPGGSGMRVAASADGHRLLAVPMGATVYASTNYGATWASNSLPPNSSWLAPACSADGRRITVIAQKGLIYSSTNSGLTWTSNSAPGLTWQSVASSADGNSVFAAPSGGKIWVRRTTPAPVLALTNSASGLVLSWVLPSAQFVVQRSDILQPPAWTDLSNAPLLNLTNLQNQLLLPTGNVSGYYRLRNQ